MKDDGMREMVSIIIELMFDELGLPLPAEGWWRGRRHPD